MRMKLKLTVIVVVLITLAATAFVSFGVWYTKTNTPEFDTAGYILQGDSFEVKYINFDSGTPYSDTWTGMIRISDRNGVQHVIPQQSFTHLNNSSMAALSDGVLLNFADLTDNFINNYYIQSGLQVVESGGTYSAESALGTVEFGEHLWKLSDARYIVVAPSLKVYLGGENDVRQVSGYVQVYMSEDGIAYLLTQENIWMTISESSYIETEGGVRVYPISQLVEDGSYKLSVAKLAVSMDDAIVLSERETRRQIVPELNITAIDGADGKDGNNGVDGSDGSAGDDGSDGSDGAEGAAGTDGKGGDGGKTGDTGQNGQAGTTGASGDNGDTGATGVGGSTGGQGTQGADALVDSSTNTAIPTMTITDWQVSGNSLKGSITVKDLANMLGEMNGERYPGKVTITNVKTKEVILCYETDATYDTDTSHDPDFPSFYRGTDKVYFSTIGAPLEPDTEYHLSVTASYKAADESGLVYTREFISRTFYTDSTGVSLSYVSATETSIDLNVHLAADYKDSVTSVAVILLTPEQNKTFTAAGVSDSTKYTAKIPIQPSEFGPTLTKRISFTGREPNKAYVARVYVETKAGLKVLTKQELDVKTLKTKPTVKENQGVKEVPTAAYNRLTGATEVYAPTVIDPDHGAVEYIYTAYRLEGSTWVEDKSVSRSASSAESVEFRLSSGTDYCFGVKLRFFDNEKDVYYDLGMSESIRTAGDSMPRLTLTPDNTGVDYNKYVGTLRISLGANTSLVTNDATKPVKVELFADSLATFGYAVELSKTSADQLTAVFVNGTDNTMGTMTLTDATSNYVDIKLDLDNLYQNTTYSLVVSGHLNVNDGNGAVSRAIGTVTFKTYPTVAIQAVYTTPTAAEAGGAALSRKLKLSIAQDTTGAANYATRAAYAENQITGGTTTSADSCGQVTVALYQGYGANMRPIAQKNFNDKTEIEELFTDGLVITERDFGNPAIAAGTSYTLEVRSVADSSFRITDLGYTNLFTNIINPTATTAGATQPPDLPNDPSTAIVAEPIYNKDAATYGAKVSEYLPDDAVIGFKLAASYNNVNRIGNKVTYYAYEYNAYVSGLQAITPSTVIPENQTYGMYLQPLMTMTQPISNASDTVPKVAVLFGGTKTASDAEAQTYNGYQVYYAGNAQATDTGLTSGMGRGFRYMFAYEVEYAISSASDNSGERITGTYPYDHGNYQEMVDGQNGGILADNGRHYGNAYILSSKMCQAPQILPDFHFYVASSTEGTIKDGAASGSIVLHYTWRDVENLNAPLDASSRMVITDNNHTRRTMISYETGNLSTPTASIPVGDSSFKLTGTDNWYTATISYTHMKTALKTITPTINISEYRLNYEAYVANAAQNQTMKVGPIAADWSWKEVAASSTIILQQELDLPNNRIDYYLQGEGAAQIAPRATAIELTFSADGATTKTLKAPVQQFTNGNTGVRIQTALLGSEYLSTAEAEKTFTVTNAKLYYDDGSQGWDKVGTGKNTAGEDTFLLQYVTDDGLEAYLGATPSGAVAASSALSTLSSGITDLTAQLRATIHQTDKEEDTKLYMSRVPLITGNAGGYYYLYPTLAGVDMGASSNTEQFTGKYAVPKGTSIYNLKFGANQADNATGKITDMTPTVSVQYLGATNNKVYAHGMEVAGFAGTGTVYMVVYEQKGDALALNTNRAKDPVAVAVPADGKVVGNPEIMNLTAKKTYYLAMYYKNSQGQDVALIDVKTSSPFVEEITTTEGTVFSNTELEYVNVSYLNKYIEMTFDMRPVYDQHLRYDIYKTQTGAENQVEAELVLKDEDLTSTLLTRPGALDFQNNELTLHLEPRGDRSVLKPGATYYLRIGAYDSQNVATGFIVQPFTLDEIGSYGALIYLKNASKDSVSATVTITDPQFSLMSNRVGSGKYVVRFTTADGKRLYTTYDNQIYNAFEAGNLQREFILSNSTLDGDNRNTAISSNTAYYLNVYAVPDADHDGSITLGDTTYLYSEIFPVQSSANGDLSEGTSLLNGFVDEFWDTAGNNASDKDDIEELLLIAQRKLTTTSDQDWSFNENGIYTSRADSITLRVNFSESIGLIDGDGVPRFRQIDWQVEGTADDGTAIKARGVEKYSQSGRMITLGTRSYQFDIPFNLPQGFYTITMQLRTQEGSEGADVSFSRTSGA